MSVEDSLSGTLSEELLALAYTAHPLSLAHHRQHGPPRGRLASAIRSPSTGQPTPRTTPPSSSWATSMSPRPSASSPRGMGTSRPKRCNGAPTPPSPGKRSAGSAPAPGPGGAPARGRLPRARPERCRLRGLRDARRDPGVRRHRPPLRPPGDPRAARLRGRRLPVALRRTGSVRGAYHRPGPRPTPSTSSPCCRRSSTTWPTA